MKKIKKENIQDIFALTPMQEGMLFHYLQDPGSDYYFGQLSLDISGEIDIDIFEKAWNFVIETNEMLRTMFRWQDVENPLQIILKEHHIQPGYYDFSGKGPGEKKKRLEAVMFNDREKKFDLQEVPSRIILCKLEQDKNRVIISNHHILYDGWSTGIILKEFLTAYDDLFIGRDPVNPVKTRFKEFIHWVRNQDIEKQEKYWRSYLEGFETCLELPIKHRNPTNVNHNKTYPWKWTREKTNEITGFSKKHQLTLASLLYSAWGILLQKYHNSDDVVFGTTVSGRSAKLAGIEDMVGLFINTLPLRTRARPHEKAVDLLKRMETELHLRQNYEHSSLVNIKKWSEIGKGQERFDSLVILENYPRENRWIKDNKGLSIDAFSMFEMTHYDLTVSVSIFAEIEVQVIYPGALFDDESIERLVEHFARIVETLMKNPGQLTAEIEIISKEEKKKLLYDFNDTQAVYPADKTIHQLFAEQVERIPDHTALIGEMQSAERKAQSRERSKERHALTYRELNNQSNRLAYILKEKGVKPDIIVGIMAERSIEMIIGILGILKTGGAYLPIDPAYPQERIDYMLKDSGAKIFLTGGEIAGPYSPQALYLFEGRHPNFPASLPSSLVYVIYTSGTTGKPKGVGIEHRSLVNRLNWMQKKYPIDSSDTILQKTIFTFDVSVWEILWWSIAGAKLCLLFPGGESDPGGITQTVQRNNVTTMHFVPSMLSAFLDYIKASGSVKKLSCLKQVIVSGEALLPGHVEQFNQLLNKENGAKLANLYGPTEAAIDVSYFDCPEVNEREIIPIGKPIDNICLYILDKYLHIQPVEISGELFISGAGLARGYLNRPGLTAEKFDRDLWDYRDYHDGYNRSYRSYKSYIPKKLYRTGDLARWQEDGNIEFLGRIDHQVKIRGFRVELGEIENRLAVHEDIKEAAVVSRQDSQKENQIIAFIVSEKNFSAARLRKYLAGQLPGYMIPAYFKRIDKLPLTPSGKVDRKALQSSAAAKSLETGTAYVPPASDMEKTIAGIWKELLETEKFGVHDNFFDIGGNSLSIIRLNSRLKKAFKKDIPMAAMFTYPTISAMAAHLSGKDKDEPKMGRETGKNDRDIAVIGMSCRFPGAKNIHEFWDNIKNGIETISFFVAEELVQRGHDAKVVNDRHYVPAKGILNDKEYFDAAFFDYTPAEAEIMDPQVRIFHECTWEALENAGYDPLCYDGAVGLYAGASPNPLWEISPLMSGSVGGSYPEIWNAIQFSDKDYLSTRIAYKLDLKGPCVTIQTACSTSLAAVDHACRALVGGACSIALAGGVSVTFQDEGGYLYQEGTIMSPDGHCRAFDADAKGTVGGNGVGIVVLKRLAEAETDRDTIYAVIKGFAINNDGKNKVGFTAPSSGGQSKVIRDALDMAGVSPESIGYIEAHGTGTLLGDPIEIEGLKLAFNAAGSRKKHYCAIGSVKTNIGHLDAAAGIAGFIKTVLSLHYRFIPPSLNFKTPNPQIDFENSPFYVNTGLKTWESNENPLRAGVSSFGLGGTNVHVVLEEAPPVGKSVNQWVSESVRKAPEGTRGLAPLSNRQYRLILLSAKTSTALDKMSENLARHFERHSHLELTEAAYTLQVGRRPFAYRKMLVCSDLEEAARKLEASEVETAAAKEEKHTVIFMFSGQGSQYVNMGYDLYKNAPMFRRQIDECFELLANIIGIDMKSVLYPGEGAPALEEAGEKIFRFKYATPIKFIFEYSLAKMLLKWGIRPDAMIGHSFGEYAAACLSGVFSLEHGIFLAALRGELMDGLVDGAMLGVPLSEKELKQQWVKEELSIAAVNGESLCVVSGPVEAVNRLEEQLNLEGYECLRFQVPKAGHSRMVEPIMEEFKKKIGKVKFHKPRIPFISCISGTWITAEEAVDPGYWTRHLREPVRFADGLTTLFKEPNPVFLQASPGQGLILFINRHPDKKSDTLALSMVRHRKEPVSDVHHTLTQIGRLWLKGCETGMNWQAFYQGEKRRRIPLPAYPFEPIHYPVNKDLFKPGTPVIPSFSKETGPSGLRKKTDTAEWFYVPSWERVMQPRDAAISKGEQPHKTPFILLFMDNRGLGPTLKERLEQGSAAVITVDMGIDFKKSHDRAYTINPTEKENYNDLLRDLASRGEMPTRVYHLWSLSRRDRDKPAKDNVNRALDRGFYSLLFLVRALGKQNVETGQGVRLEVVTGGALEVNGDEELYPESAPVYGLCRVIPQEYPEIHCRCIDITLPRGDVIGEKQVRQLWSEFSSVSPDRVTAYRGNYRWVETFKPFRLEKNQPGALPLKQGGVYVITGGLGAIALVLAQYLAKTFKARLILTGRSDFPPRQEWGREKASRKVQRLMEMEKAGAEVLVMKADVSSLDRMQAVFQQGEEKFGPINGVIHAAGIVGEKSFCPLKDMGKKEAQLHFEPKVYGLLVLEEILKNRPMDFCLLMSSTASVLGGLGFGAYSAANRFMDAYIYRLARSGRTRWISVNWDGWQLEEKQIEDTALGAEIKELAMTPQEGVEVFQRILAWPEARQVIECTGDLQSRIHRWVKMQGPQVPDQEKETGGKKPGLVLRQPRPHLSNPYIPPRSSREKQVAGIWEELLRYEHIGLQDNFFELNGDSLKAVIAISKIHKQAGVKVPLKDFFAHPTVEEIARYIVRAEGSMYDSIQPVEKKEYYPISSAQQGMFILHRYEKERKSTAYNIPVVMELTGELDRETFLTVFQELIRRHESLRTSFLMIEDKPVQRIHDEVEVKVEEVTGKRRIEGWKGRRVEEEKEGSQRIEGTGGLAPMSIEPAANTVKNFIRPFDLSQAPLLRIGLIKKETQTHILMLDIHHIVSDGVSMGILVREFIPLYEGGKLPALSIRYKDFSAWQNQWFRSPKSKEQEDYWLNRLKGDIPVLKMKTDFPRPAVKHFEGDCLALEIDEKLTGKVKQMMSKTGTTFFQVLLAAYSILISKYTRQQDIIVGVPIAGRGHVDLESIIGMFVNTLAIRIHQRKDLGFLEFLAEVKKRLLEAYENQDYPLEELVKKLDIPKDLSRNPLFDVLFVSENLDIPKLAAKDLEFHPYEFENKITHLDLVLYFVEIGNKIRMKLEYSTGLFKDETVRTMLEHYIEIVEQIVDNREICIKDIRLSHDFSPAHSTVLPETQIEFSF